MRETPDLGDHGPAGLNPARRIDNSGAQASCMVSPRSPCKCCQARRNQRTYVPMCPMPLCACLGRIEPLSSDTMKPTKASHETLCFAAARRYTALAIYGGSLYVLVRSRPTRWGLLRPPGCIVLFTGPNSEASPRPIPATPWSAHDRARKFHRALQPHLTFSPLPATGWPEPTSDPICRGRPGHLTKTRVPARTFQPCHHAP